MDEQLAMFVVESHRRSHPSAAAVPSAGDGTGDEEADEDNTAIINDKVRSVPYRAYRTVRTVPCRTVPDRTPEPSGG